MGKIVLTGLLLGLGLQLFATDFEMMLKLGVTNTDEQFSDKSYNKNSKLLTGFDAGAILGFYPVNKLGLQVEPGITTKGSEHDNLFGVDNDTYRIYYASLPVLINYKAYKKLHIFAGPEFNRIVDVTGDNGESKFDGTNYYTNKNETGIQAGVSYTLLKRWYFAVKYSCGLSKTTNFDLSNALPVSFGSVDYYNQGLIVNVGWKLF